MTTTLSHRRTLLPRPAICESKQIIFTYNALPWTIPILLHITIEATIGSGGPPDKEITTTITAAQRPGRLAWRANVKSLGSTFYLELNFDPTAGNWSIYYTQTWPDGEFTAFTISGVHETLVPTRSASCTYYIPGTEGRAIRLTLKY